MKAIIDCLGMSKVKLELWMLVLMFICGTLVFLYMNGPTPTSSTDLSVEASRAADAHKKLKNDLVDCEKKSTETKLYLAEKLTELTNVKRQIEENSDSSKSVQDSERIVQLESEIDKLKQQNEGSKTNNDSLLYGPSTVQRKLYQVSNYLPTYDSKTLGTNPSYLVNPKFECWAPDCSPDILNNREAYSECRISVATTWNALGVRNMERFVGLPKRFPTMTNFQRRYLSEAYDAFLNATYLDPSCSRAWVNLALVLMQYDKPQDALDAMAKGFELNKSARNYAILGFVQDIAGDRESALKSWEAAIKLDPKIGERKYFGIMVINDGHPDRHIQEVQIKEFSKEIENPMARDVLTYIEFSPVSIANYATLPPGSQEFFVKNQFIILQDVVPPFVLRSIANCFKRLRENNLLHLGDHQSKRYSSYNGRAGRIIQYQLVDLMRRTVVHNVHPTYSFFGAYIGGALLPPHTDKPQCEFTWSLTLDQTPEDAEPWAISLGRKTLFFRNETYTGSGTLQLPPEDEIVDGYLYPGDALLFMGRHLNHFRRYPLPEGNILDQIFIHHVPETYQGYYDI